MAHALAPPKVYPRRYHDQEVEHAPSILKVCFLLHCDLYHCFDRENHRECKVDFFNFVSYFLGFIVPAHSHTDSVQYDRDGDCMLKCRINSHIVQEVFDVIA